MTNRFKNTVKILCVCLAIFLPLTTHAQPSGEIIFRHSIDVLEIWKGKVREGRTSRRIFNRPLLAMSLAIQRGDRYILTVAERFADDELALAIDAYLLDRQKPHATEKNLTQGKYGEIIDADISKNGDVVFTSEPTGLYLIPKQEIEKPTPKAVLLLPIEAGSVDWSPNGKVITYCTVEGIFGFDLFTKTQVKYTRHGCGPVFSPDGKYIAYIHWGDRKKKKVGLFSLSRWRTVQTIEIPEKYTGIRYLTWTADGQYIVYSVNDDPFYRNFAISLDGFHTTRILGDYPGGVPILEWTNKVYAVEPTNRLTTLWGELKQQDLK